MEFLNSGKPQLAWVVDEQGGKLKLFTANKREIKLAAARVLPWTGPQLTAGAGRSEMEAKLAEHQNIRDSLAAEIDLMEIWELAQGEMESAPVKWFADLIWDEPGPDRLAALGRAMLEDKSHFKFNPPEFTVFPEEEVERRKQEEQARKEREQLVSLGNSLMRKLWANRRPEPGVGWLEKAEREGLDKELAERIRDMLLDQLAKKDTSPDSALFGEMCRGLQSHPAQPLILAQSWGIVEPHHNHLLNETGYVFGDQWAREFEDETDRLEAALDKRDKTADPRNFISIDAATTRDIDDAFHIEKTDDNGFRLAIALAMPCIDWDFDSEFNEYVQNRGTSIYLPEGSSHMLPERLGTYVYSLVQDGPRPALIMDIVLNQAGEPVDKKLYPAMANVANTTYERAQQDLEQGAEYMVLARDLAGKLLQRRIDSGAVIIRRPEPVVTLTDDNGDIRVDIELKSGCSDADMVVGEFMMLANSTASDFAEEHGFSLINRCQDIVLPPETAGEWSNPEDVFNLVKLLAPPVMDVERKPHASLGVPGYAPISSPLRRYTDFMNMAQMQAYLETGTPRWSKSELSALATMVSARTQEVSTIQRFRPRYWKLLYLRQNKKKPLPGVVVGEQGPFITVALPLVQIYVRVPQAMAGEKCYPGQDVLVVMGQVDPLLNEIRVAELLEG